MESQATQSSAYVLTQATPPALPSSPNVERNVLVSLVLGLALAIAAAILLELADRRVHTVDEVSGLVGLPLLGVLPKPGGKGKFVSRRIPLVSSRAMFNQLPAPHKEA